MKRRIWFYVLSLLFMLIATGCMNPPSQGKPGGEAPAVISVWYTLEGKNEEELLRQFARINSERSEVLIKGVKVPESTFAERVWKLQAGGEGPEIMIASRLTIQKLYEKGAISPVLVDEKSYKSYPAAQASFRYNGQAFALPWIGDIPILYYNKERDLKQPSSLAELFERKNTLAVKNLNMTLLSPWWKAEGGKLSAKGVPVLDSPANNAFIQKILLMRSGGLFIIDDMAREKFINGEADYFLGLTSERLALDRAEIPWGSIAITSLLGADASVLLDKTLGIANSSIKTVPAMEKAIEVVEEELLSWQTQAAITLAGGKIPLSSDYYEQTTDSFASQAALSLKNAWQMEGLAVDWTIIPFLDRAFANIIKGEKVEAELEKGQSLALEHIKNMDDQ